jgi:hypothetical protein
VPGPRDGRSGSGSGGDALGTIAVTLALAAALGAGLRAESPTRAVGGGRLTPRLGADRTDRRRVARSLIYWFRDGRQSRRLLLLPCSRADADLVGLFDLDAIVRVVLPLSAFAGLSCDGTAFAAGSARH